MVRPLVRLKASSQVFTRWILSTRRYYTVPISTRRSFRRQRCTSVSRYFRSWTGGRLPSPAWKGGVHYLSAHRNMQVWRKLQVRFVVLSHLSFSNFSIPSDGPASIAICIPSTAFYAAIHLQGSTYKQRPETVVTSGHL